MTVVLSNEVSSSEINSNSEDGHSLKLSKRESSFP